MPVVSNRHYNNPELGAALSGLAGAFAPPSGSDVAGYSTAMAKQQEAARLAELFNYAKDPNYDQTKADRMGVLGGLYAPSQSYYSVDQSNATSRRGQDISANTSLTNNQADNARALEQTRLTNTKDITTSMLAPVAQGATRFVPPTIADMYGVPGTQVGAISAGQGDTVATPDGRVITGAAKPLTDSEVKGAILQQLPQNDQRNAALAGVDVEQVIGPDGKPIYVNRPQAAGMQAYNKPTADSATELTKLMAERDALPAGDPNRQAYDARIAALGRGQQQSAYDKASDEEFAKLNTELFSNATKAVADRGLYSTVLSAVNNPNVDQGTFANAQLGLRKALNSFGVNAGDTGPAEMLNALGNQISLKLRDPSSGAGMPGAMSDADREYLKTMSVALGNSPQANRLLAQYYIGAQQRAIDMNDLRQRYVQQHGRLDEGFRAEMADYLKKSDPTAAIRAQISGGNAAPPAPATAQPATSGAPEIGMVMDGYRFKGGDPANPNSWEAAQ